MKILPIFFHVFFFKSTGTTFRLALNFFAQKRSLCYGNCRQTLGKLCSYSVHFTYTSSALRMVSAWVWYALKADKLKILCTAEACWWIITLWSILMHRQCITVVVVVVNGVNMWIYPANLTVFMPVEWRFSVSIFCQYVSFKMTCMMMFCHLYLSVWCVRCVVCACVRVRSASCITCITACLC